MTWYAWCQCAVCWTERSASRSDVGYMQLKHDVTMSGVDSCKVNMKLLQYVKTRAKAMACQKLLLLLLLLLLTSSCIAS